MFQKVLSETPSAKKPAYPRSLPDDTSDPVALVKERVVNGREAGVLKEEATLQTLPLQGGVLLPLKGLHRSEHPAALKKTTQVRRKNTGQNTVRLPHSYILLKINQQMSINICSNILEPHMQYETTSLQLTRTLQTDSRIQRTEIPERLCMETESRCALLPLSTAWIYRVKMIHLSIH